MSVDIEISIFKEQNDTHPETHELPWDSFVELFHDIGFPIVEDKTKYTHFSLSTFDGDKRGEHGLFLYGLVLDFDEHVSVEQAEAMFEKYEYVFYTSYNHQRWKTTKSGERLPPRDKFRIIIPFVERCPAAKWQEINEYVLTFAPGVDPASKKFVQAYTAPCTPEDNIANTMMWHHKGAYLDWKTFPANQFTTQSGGQANPANRSGNTFPKDFIITLKQGTIIAENVDRRYQCYCPFHNDKSPGAFVNRSDKGSIYISCHKCGTAYMENDEDDVSRYVRELTTARTATLQTKHRASKDDLLIYDDEPQAVLPFSREKRAKLLEKKCVGRRYKTMLLYAFEGFGKSYYAVLEARKGNKVLFTSSSNEQAYEQAKGFESLGLSVQIIPGREYVLRTQYGVEVVERDPSHPWDTDLIDERKTKRVMIETGKWTKEQVDEIWEATAPPHPDFYNHDIVCTTIARVGVWGRIQGTKVSYFGPIPTLSPDNAIIPQDTIVFFDDPAASYFLELSPYDDRYANAKAFGKPLQTLTIENRSYFVRPIEFSIAFGLIGVKVVFTTTELMIRELIKRKFENLYQPKLMPDEKMSAGDIVMIKSELVRAKKDGLLPPLMMKISYDDAFDFTYIADGQGTAVNLVSSKGQNKFVGVDTVIEISFPHYSVVQRYLDDLGLGESDRSLISLILALDALQQAIGRNSGYRATDSQAVHPKCIVVCEPQLYTSLLNTMRYNVSTKIPNPLAVVSLNDKRETLVASVCWHIAYVDRVVLEQREHGGRYLPFTKQIHRALESSGSKKYQLAQRMKTALTERYINKGTIKTKQVGQQLIEELDSYFRNPKEL